MPISALEDALRDYDGKHADVLKELRDDVAPKAAVLRQAVKLALHGDAHIAQGATWLLWAWLTRGAQLTVSTNSLLVASLAQMQDKWVLLHVVRCLPLMTISSAETKPCLAFLQRCLAGELPFLRAWAVDSLHRLALEHEQHAGVARRALENCAEDPAPSVRKRVQKILRGQ